MRSVSAAICLWATLSLAAPLPMTIPDWSDRAPQLGETLSLKIFPSRVEVSRDSFDNTPYSPPAEEAVEPHVVLSSARPIATTYLMNLANKLFPGTKQNQHSDEGMPLTMVTDQTPMDGHQASPDGSVTIGTSTSESMDPSTEAALLAGSGQDIRASQIHFHRTYTQIDIPCYYNRMRHSYDDMLVIVLLALFLLVIVAVELWDSNHHQSDDETAGTIRLEECVQVSDSKSCHAQDIVIGTTINPSDVEYNEKQPIEE